MISVTTIVENVFCPRFTYYSEVLGLKQYEEKRATVSLGKQHHSKSEKTNKQHMIEKLEGTKYTSKKLYSTQHDLVGIVDHAIETNDYVVIIERKYTNNTIVYDTLRVQLGLLAILLEENLHKPVKYACVIFTKGNTRKIINIDISEQIKKFALKMMYETKQIIETGIIPESKYDNRCADCCYRKNCEYGSLNTS